MLSKKSATSQQVQTPAKKTSEEKTKKIDTGEKRKHPIKNDKKTESKSPQRKVQKTHEPSERNLHNLSPSPERTDVIIDNDNEKAEVSNKKISLNERNLLSSMQHNATENISILNVDAEKIIMDLFLVKMPKDFFQFYEFCKNISKNDPLSACKSVRLKLVGPYDVLDGKIKISSSEDNKEEYLIHWRYYYDPPEFQTIVKCDDKEGLHFGYWRDDAMEKPVFVAKN